MNSQELAWNVLLPLLRELTQLDELAIDSSNSCRIVIENQFAVRLTVGDDGASLILFATIGEIPPNRIDIQTALLQANFFWQDTKGCVLSLNKSAKLVMLAYHTPFCIIDKSKLEELLLWFIPLVQEWHTKLHDLIASHSFEDFSQSGNMVQV